MLDSRILHPSRVTTNENRKKANETEKKNEKRKMVNGTMANCRR
jgi:hypothetical protein